jgi:RNA polymerase sigma factor (sigma-70 family)
MSTDTTSTLDPQTLVEAARSGDRDALEQLVRAIQDPVYGLAMRMLALPTEAEDATQEILIKVVTRLGSFRGDSKFTTWVYAVAANHLRTVRRGQLWSERAREAGLVDETNPLLAGHPAHSTSDEGLEGLDELQRIEALVRSLPRYRAPRHLIRELNRILTIERHPPLES